MRTSKRKVKTSISPFCNLCEENGEQGNRSKSLRTREASCELKPDIRCEDQGRQSSQNAVMHPEGLWITSDKCSLEATRQVFHPQLMKLLKPPKQGLGARGVLGSCQNQKLRSQFQRSKRALTLRSLKKLCPNSLPTRPTPCSAQTAHLTLRREEADRRPHLF